MTCHHTEVLRLYPTAPSGTCLECDQSVYRVGKRWTLSPPCQHYRSKDANPFDMTPTSEDVL